MNPEITTLKERSDECDDFIQRAAGARLCHTYAWTRMVEDAFGYKGHYTYRPSERSDWRGPAPDTRP